MRCNVWWLAVGLGCVTSALPRSGRIHSQVNVECVCLLKVSDSLYVTCGACRKTLALHKKVIKIPPCERVLEVSEIGESPKTHFICAHGCFCWSLRMLCARFV